MTSTLLLRPRRKDMAKKQARKARGRPEKDESERKSKPIPVRFREADEAIVREAAERRGLKLSGFVRAAAIAEARRELGLD